MYICTTGGVDLGYSTVVDKLKKISCVISVEINDDGMYGDICIEAANDLYLASVNVKREDFVPGRTYDCYIPATRNFEALCYRCVEEDRMIHSYMNVEQYHAWMETYMLPLQSDEEGKSYILFSYDMKAKVDAEKLSDLSPDIAVKVIQIAVKLRETDDFQLAMDSIISNIRINCEANRCCILLTDFENDSCSVLCENVTEAESGIPNVTSYIEDGFFEVVKTWDELIAGSNCYIIHDAEELKLLEAKNKPWYDSLILAGVYSLVIYPLKANGETIGYIWATNFNSENTLNIKAILEIMSFILASEISNHQLFEKTKMLSATDLLTGLYNRNAMNNRITNIVSGHEDVGEKYGIVFADLNGLKEVNDTKGHIAGDNLLKSAASILLDVFLDSEIYRVGGDEFLIIVTNHTEDDFNSLVSSLRTACDNSSKVKLAIGTWYGDKSFDIRTAMHLADERMYADKEAYYKLHPELKYRGKKV